jgi:hypothetical protein
MKVYVHRSSGWTKDGEVREYEDLETCVKTLLETENFHNWSPELIISKIDDLVPDFGQNCDYQIEIYDAWRE